MVRAVFSVLGIALLCFVISLCLYIFVKLFRIYIKYLKLKKVKKKYMRGFKRKLYSYLYILMYTKFLKPVDFCKWTIYDILHGKDYLRLYGIWAFTGYYGEGKTLGAVTYAKHLQATNPHRDIKIASNTNIQGQIRKVTDWREILNLPSDTIFIYDESQNDYSSNMREFPEDLLRRITQCRKRRLTLFMTSPKYNRMNINIRESVSFVVECKNRFGYDRWFSYTFYHSEDYEQYFEDKKKLRKNKYGKHSFIATNKNYRVYNTQLEVDSIKQEENDEDVKKITKTQINKLMRNEYMKHIEALERRISKVEGA